MILEGREPIGGCHQFRFSPSGSPGQRSADSVLPDPSTLRTVLRETFRSRTISLIRAALDEKSHQIRVIVSQTYIPTPVQARNGKHRQLTGGSKMNADHTAAGGAGPAHKTSRQR